MILLQFKHLLC